MTEGNDDGEATEADENDSDTVATGGVREAMQAEAEAVRESFEATYGDEAREEHEAAEGDPDDSDDADG